MAGKFNGFLDQLINAILGPKGNLADWQHANRMFIDDNMRLLPKNKFLYHVHFKFNPVAREVFPALDKVNLEIGLLVKAADLPRFTAQVETRNKYNRKKNIQTSIQYEPITIKFHDDTAGITTAILEAYYRYYFADGRYGETPGAYNKAGIGDNTYLGRGRNGYKYGLDNNISTPFINSIEISQMARQYYTTYTIVNPIISQWEHDAVQSDDNGTFMENSITVQYEAVHYSRGSVETGDQGNPVGFGSQEHYDKQPSPISLLGGGDLGLLDSVQGISSLYTSGALRNPLTAGLAAYQLANNLKNLDSEGLRRDGYTVAGSVLGEITGVPVNGLRDTAIPKTGGTGGESLVVTQPIDLTPRENRSTYDLQNDLNNNPAALNAYAKDAFKADYLSDGGSSINGVTAAWNELPETVKEEYRRKVILSSPRIEV